MNTASLARLALCTTVPTLINAQLSHSPIPNERENLSVQYDQSRWQLIKRVNVVFRSDGMPSKILLLKSRKQTGSNGVGEPMNDVELLISQGDRVLYDYAKQGATSSEYNGTRFFMDDYLEIRDVTGGGLPEVLFHSGSQGASDSLTLEHILHYDKPTGSVIDIAPQEFFASGTHGLGWLMLKGRASLVIATRNWKSTTPLEERCHYCPSPFNYDVYQWNNQEKRFRVHRHLLGEKDYEDADQALNGDWLLIQQAER
jgi:hypothetical protein